MTDTPEVSIAVMAHRKDEAPKTWFRSERIFRSDGQWFIHTREGIEVGPYPDKFAAEVDAERLKSLLVGLDAEEATSIIKEFMLDGGKTLGGLRGEPFTGYLLDEGMDALNGNAV